MKFGIVCDIDGVLVKGDLLIHRSVDALRLLSKDDKFRVPFLFVTNGGDATEAAKARKLAIKSLPFISKEHVLVSHSPLKSFTKLAEQKLLLIGRSEDTLHQVAKEYGWNRYETIQQFVAKHQYLIPHRVTRGALPSEPINKTTDFDSLVVLSTPTAWEETLQVMLDLLAPSEGPSGKIQITDVYFANVDFVYSDAYVTPRLGNGAFLRCLEVLFKETYGLPLNYTPIGKPYPITYKYAAQTLDNVLGSDEKCSTIYAIGDNPKSDIQGANQAGPRWFSILVRTGCFQGTNDSEFPARYVCDDLMDAVRFILEREGFHSNNEGSF